MNAVLKRAAVELGWPEDLEWVGHRMRHGGANAVMEQTGSVDEVQRLTGHRNRQVAEPYARNVNRSRP